MSEEKGAVSLNSSVFNSSDDEQNNKGQNLKDKAAAKPLKEDCKLKLLSFLILNLTVLLLNISIYLNQISIFATSLKAKNFIIASSHLTLSLWIFS